MSAAMPRSSNPSNVVGIDRTNADRIQPWIDGQKAMARHLAANPDEAAVLFGPAVVLALLTARRLPLLPYLAVTESGYVLGVLLLKEYRAWKARPATKGQAPWKF